MDPMGSCMIPATVSLFESWKMSCSQHHKAKQAKRQHILSWVQITHLVFAHFQAIATSKNATVHPSICTFFPITTWILKEKYFEISYSTAVHRLWICPRSHVYAYIHTYVWICLHRYSLICDSHLTTVPWFVTTSQVFPGPSISPGSMSTVVIVSEVKGLRPGRPIHAIWIPRFLGLLTRMTTYIS